MERTKITVNGKEIEIEIYESLDGWIALDVKKDEVIVKARNRRALGFELIEIQK